MRRGRVRDHHVCAGLGGVLDGLELGVHAALGESALLARMDELHRVADAADGGNAAAFRVQQPVHRREQHERVGAHELDDEGREPVVVAERESLQLLVGHDVVLVDHRHDAGAHEMVERAAQVRGAAAVVEVGVR